MPLDHAHAAPPLRRARRARRTATVVLLAGALLLAACSQGGGDGDDRADRSSTTTTPSSGGPSTTGPLGSGTTPMREGVRIEVLSSQPDRVTGDEARVRVHPAPGGSASDLRLTLGATDVTGQLAEREGGLEGVVRGFIEGNNTLTATSDGQHVQLRVRAWPRTGPVFSGPHGPLLACSTEAQGLGAPTDADCSAQTDVSWRYVAKDGSVKDLADPSSPPADVEVATIDGDEVPLYVRVERGVVNRAVYEVASVDPTPDDDPLGPGWNGRFLYRFGGSPRCDGLYGQGAPATSAVAASYLEQGYVVATSSFNNWDVACNDVLSAETTMMVKERLIEVFGAPAFTIGEGSSMGAAQLHLIAQNYPGLINGIVASSPFPDALTVQSGATDCLLLARYFDSAAGRALTPAERAAIAGHATADTCRAWADRGAGALDPTDGCDPAIAASRIYDPATNPTGLRCTMHDASRNLFGDALEGPGAARPLDNVGVQYGFEALNAGTITPDEFLDLNAEVGGIGPDGQPAQERTEADLEAVLHAYETGRVSMGSGDQRNLPTIEVDPYTDRTGDIHDRVRAFSYQDRVAGPSGPEGAPGLQIWTVDGGARDLASALERSAVGGPDAVEAVEVLDEWLTDLREADGTDPLGEALEDARPDDAESTCTLPDGGSGGRGVDVYEGGGRCAAAYPIAGGPRIAAGGPRSDQVLKCNLKPVDPRDYEVDLTDAQLQRLAAIFPQGVCDWLGPSQGETAPATPDRSYEDVQSPSQSA